MKKLLIVMLLATTIAHAETYKMTAADEPLDVDDNQATIVPQVEGLKEQMLNDEGVMALISAMQGDPEMRSLLSDPAVVNAVQAGDVASLMANPAFLKILDDPRVKEIEKRLNIPEGN